LFRTTYPDSSFDSSAFDSNGNRTNSVDRAGHPTSYIFDALNWLKQTIFADGATSATVFDDLGRVKFTIDARGVTNAFGYNPAGERVAVTNALGTSVQMTNRFGYDANGNQIIAIDGLGHSTTNVFDPLNRVVEMDYADGTKTFTGYDAAGRRVAETNQDTVVTRFGYDGAGRLIAVTNAYGVTGQQSVTQYQYDEAGNQTAQIDALNRTTTFACLTCFPGCLCLKTNFPPCKTIFHPKADFRFQLSVFCFSPQRFPQQNHTFAGKEPIRERQRRHWHATCVQIPNALPSA